jgi:deaminated glutathione amidase
MTYLAAVIQMTSTSDKAANLKKAERMIRLAAARGARLVALPETFNWRGKRTEEAAAAEDLSGPTLTAMARWARELEVYLLAGSITEHVPNESRRYNTSVLFGPDGTHLATYRKIHLFDIDLPGRVTVKESAAKMPGSEVVTASTELGTVGLTVCYDVRFPELYRRLVYAGANIITIPSAFTFPTGEAHWEVLIRARAIENQCYVLAPAQFGTNVHGFADYGNSMIVDPWGRVLARAADQEGVLVAPVDMEYLERVRRELPSLTHTRLR